MAAKKKPQAPALGAGGAAPQIGGKRPRTTCPDEKGKRAARQSRSETAPGTAPLFSQKKQKASSRCRARYEPYNYEDTFDQQLANMDEAAVRRMIDEQHLAVYATKTVKAGSQLDVEVFPEFTRLPSWAKRERNLQAQRDLNDKNSRKECDRRINANFTPADMWLTLSYYDRTVPQTMEEAQRNIANYIRRVQYRRKKAGLPPAKVVKVTDWTKEDGPRRRRVHCHHHLVISGGLPMEQLLALWTLGRKKEARQLELDERGLSGLAQYITKPHMSDTEEIKHKKKWSASKNLRVPEPRKNHQQFRRRRVEKIAAQPGLMAGEMESKYPGYWYENGSVRYNGCVGLFYLAARLRQKAQPGDLVTITGRAELLEKLPPQTLAKLDKQPGGKFRVLAADYHAPGWETAFLEITGRSGKPEQLAVPARACIVIDTTGRIT